MLEPGNFSENDGNIYCKTCYGWVSIKQKLQHYFYYNSVFVINFLLTFIFCRKSFGPKGYGFGGGAGVLSMEKGTVVKETASNPRKHPGFPSGDEDHLVSSSSSVSSSRASSSLSLSSPGTSSGPAKPRWGGGDICPNCLKTVYFAEQVKAAHQTWHRGCFTCTTCGKRLDTSTVCDKDDKLYCRTCYGRNFGPKGVGYGVGAGTLKTN